MDRREARRACGSQKRDPTRKPTRDRPKLTDPNLQAISKDVSTILGRIRSIVDAVLLILEERLERDRGSRPC